MPGVLQRRLAAQAGRFRRGGRASMLWSLRLTAAATASFVVASVLFPRSVPLLAPLTALLVVQVTPVSLLASGLDRVASVVVGVGLAVVFSTVVPLEWWSLGLLIAVAISVGQALRLRANLIEVAISAMLVLGVGSFGAGSAAWERITETLVGAAVGIVANLVFPPQVSTADAGAAIDELADRLARLLTRAAGEIVALPAEDLARTAGHWLDDSRDITYDVPNAGAALLRAEESRRLNVRAAGTADVGPGLRQGLEALEHSAVAVRVMFRSVRDATADPDWPGGEVSETVCAGLALVFTELAGGLDAFGELVRVEATRAHPNVVAETHRLEAALTGMHEARARVSDALTDDAGPVVTELHSTVLSTVKRLLAELDLDARIRRQVRLRRRSRGPVVRRVRMR